MPDTNVCIFGKEQLDGFLIIGVVNNIVLPTISPELIGRQLQAHRHPSAFPQQLRLQQTERHRDQHQPQHQIHAAREQLDFGPVKGARRHQIPKANCRQCDEAEVRPVHEAPVLPQRKDGGADADVPEQNDQNDGDGHLR